MVKATNCFTKDNILSIFPSVGKKICWNNAILYCLVFLPCVSNLFAAIPTAPDNLLVNGIENPQAIDNGTPLFTWMMHDVDRGEVQTACQILVASSHANIDANVGDLWNSGKLLSARSASFKYSGSALSSATRYWWKVQLWDKDGNASPYSAAATFDVGLAKADWTARYIWDGTVDTNNFAFFRKSFSISKAIKLAKVYVSAHNDYQLFVNGVLLGMGPARSDPYTYGQYNGYDITSYLTTGVNAFAAKGHWHGKFYDSGINGEPAFILEARIEFSDNTKMTVVTDATWKILASTPFIETSPVYFGQYGGVNNRPAIKYDARLEPLNWTSVTFNDAPWQNAALVSRSNYNLFAQRVAPQREQQELAPISVTAGGTTKNVDFDKCYNGWPKLTMRNNAAGSVVTVNYYQMASGGDAGWDQYTCKGGVETWKPDFGRHTSFKRMTISGYTGTLAAADIRGILAYSDATSVGSFTCSSTLLNNIFTMSERSARQNVQQGIISVDANREQSPWTADSWNVGNGLFYNHKNTMIFDKIVRDYAAEQYANGNFPSCAPAAVFDIPEWSMYWPMLLWEQYLFSGDDVLLNDMYPKLQKFLTWLAGYRQSTNLIDPSGWRISEYAGGSMTSGGQNIATNSHYYRILQIAASIATILSKSSEATAYSATAAAVKQAINTSLFTGRSYYSSVGSTQQHVLGATWALRFDIVPADKKKDVVAWIRNASAIDIGGYGGDAFYSGILHAGGLGDVAGNDLSRYTTMLNGNATNWETWNAGEYNHAWTSYPAYLFQKYISGIQPTDAAFSTFMIQPEIAGLSTASSTIPTVKGDIATSWKQDSVSFDLSATVPANSSCLVFLPKLGSDSIDVYEGTTLIWTHGAVADSVLGVTLDTAEADRLVWLTGSGSYSFKVRPSSHLANLYITADDAYDLYVNGRAVGFDSLWYGAEKYSVILTEGRNVIAVKAMDFSASYGLLAEIVRNGVRAGTGAGWKVSTTLQTGWNTVGFNDASWPAATVIASYGNAPWNTVTGIPDGTPAQWIWGPSSVRTVYLRYTFDVTPAVAVRHTLTTAEGAAGKLVFSISGSRKHYAVDIAGVKSIRIFDLAGRMVRSLAVAPASREAVWDRRNTKGAMVHSGMYLINFKGKNGERTVTLHLEQP